MASHTIVRLAGRCDFSSPSEARACFRFRLGGWKPPLLVAAMLGIAIVSAFAQTKPPNRMTISLRWGKLPPLPDPEGFAAPFAGVSGGALIVAGGANIPGDRWADSFVKK